MAKLSYNTYYVLKYKPRRGDYVLPPVTTYVGQFVRPFDISKLAALYRQFVSTKCFEIYTKCL